MRTRRMIRHTPRRTSKYDKDTVIRREEGSSRQQKRRSPEGLLQQIAGGQIFAGTNSRQVLLPSPKLLLQCQI